MMVTKQAAKTAECDGCEAYQEINHGDGLQEIYRQFQESFSLHPINAENYSPLTLAFLGDAVYELCIRALIVEQSNAPVNKLNRRSSRIVNAGAQAAMMRTIEPLLTQEEQRIYHRGRNAKSYTTAKNATISDYRMATGLEALMGYLFLKQDIRRIMQLLTAGLSQEAAAQTRPAADRKET